MTPVAASNRKQWGSQRPVVSGEEDATWAPICSRPRSRESSEALAELNLTEGEVAWSVYQDIVTANRSGGRSKGRRLLQAVIDTLGSGPPAELSELKWWGRTLKRRVTDVLGFFTGHGTPNGPPEAINGRLEHLRGSALGFRNLTHYIARCLLESGGFRPVLHTHLSP